MNINIAFRTDASRSIGAGHLMRCLTLATELIEHGAHIRFLVKDLPNSFKDLFKDRSIEFAELELEKNFICSTGESRADIQLQDMEATNKALADKKWDWLIVDHYQLGYEWESGVKKYVKKIMVIDDLADREHFCDILLDQNYYANSMNRYVGKVPNNCVLLLGPKYILLRKEFLEMRDQVKVRSGGLKKILIFFGGTDKDDYTTKAIDALISLNLISEVSVVIGSEHPNGRQIQLKCIDYGYRCYVQISNIAEIMKDADLSIGAGGTATWERCYMGLPSLCVSIAKNQDQQIFDIAELGILLTLPSNGSLEKNIATYVSILAENPPLLKHFSKMALDFIDGFGVSRVCAEIVYDGITVELARKEDVDKVYGWRNDDKVRKSSKNSQPFSFSEHKKWFDSALLNNDCYILIGYYRNVPLGVVRFNIDNNIAEVSIYLVPKGKFKGLGRSLLRASENWLKKIRPEIVAFNATVLAGNKSSALLFDGSNYGIVDTSYQKTA